MILLQPYRRFDVRFIAQLSRNGSFYLVSQSYRRANAETDHTKTPVLFSAYKDRKEAVHHYQRLKQDKDQYAAYVDIRTKMVTAKLVNICNGNSNLLPYLSVVGNLQYINNYIDRHYRDKIRSWIKKNRETWKITEPNSLQPSFQTVMGEPMVNIKWGSHSVTVKLEDIEQL